ncbi:MAG: hypothetical protein J6J83_02945 [Oscillospiraceae bacterium]|nr:hypothetical protein [Oscillospiraceae bacterium]
MQKSLKGLRCFIDSEERTPKDIYKFVRFYEPEAVADLKKVKAYLFKDFNDSAKVHQLLAAVRVKEYLTENRDHNRQSRRPYDVYKLLYPQGTISEKNFNEGFEIIDAVELVDEGGDINASKTVARWRAMGESRESILRFLKAIAASSGVVPDLYQLSDGAVNGQITKKEFFETVKLFAKSGPSGTIDALCALEFGEKSDGPLENALVYYSVSSALREGDSVLIVEPSCEFVRKWMLDEYIRDCHVTFAVSDKEVCSVLAGHYKAMKYAQFVTVENITGVI